MLRQRQNTTEDHLPPSNVDIEPGRFELPTLRRAYPDGYRETVALADATSDDIAATILETLKFRRLVLDAITDQLNALSGEQLGRLNRAERAA